MPCRQWRKAREAEIVVAQSYFREPYKDFEDFISGNHTRILES